MNKKRKAPFGMKITGEVKDGNRIYYCLKLKWWFAIYTAIVSCFTASWFAEDILRILNEGEEDNGKDMAAGSCRSENAD